MSNDQWREIIGRIEHLEKAVFGKKAMPFQKPTPTVFAGATGGVRLLLSKGFFKQKKPLAEVRVMLAKNGYHYSAQAVQMALSRLSGRIGPLTTLKNGGHNVYVERK